MNNKKKEQLSDNEKEQLIIEKFQKHEKLNIIFTTVMVFLGPLIMISLYFAKFYNLKIAKLIEVIVVIIILISIIIFGMLRRCPNCGAFFGKYTVFPSKCPYCGVRLK